MKWFLNINDKIEGPHSGEEILAGLSSGHVSYSSYIWAKGQVEWIPISDWEDNYDELMRADSNRSFEQTWKVRYREKVVSGLNMKTVLETLKNHENLKSVFISPEDEDQWLPIYSSYMFMEALKLSRRNFLRAPLMGLAKVTRTDAKFSYVVKTATIGQGGLGVYGLGSNFQVGTEVKIRVESENLTAPLNVIGKVVYSTPSGFIGISMDNLSAEAKAVILGYIKKFKDSGEADIKAAS